jgi:hypothetical protein
MPAGRGAMPGNGRALAHHNTRRGMDDMGRHDMRRRRGSMAIAGLAGAGQRSGAENKAKQHGNKVMTLHDLFIL